MLPVLWSVLGAVLLVVAVFALLVDGRRLRRPVARPIPWRLLAASATAALFLVLLGLAVWSDVTCHHDCEPTVTPVYP
ncbi:hypothetical protein [Streptomyces galbus]|uniref:Uncharacterized protein n=1 Tax=Streptomyces galbus TaxID=33898 RepID=A0A4U5WVT9_STRGB|nr:hypothetical protein [Streptomyces galbus]TKT06625.1 hypothetical protein E4U92_26620 [Streptomyces galbus]GHD53638.1 hypothetical protein GCM10010335_67360 [Streptomyces galbus]